MRNAFYLNILGVLMFFVFGVNAVYAESPNLFFSIPSKQIQKGEKVSVDVLVRSSLQSINAISGVISFPANLVSVASISKDKSIVSIWTNDPKVLRDKISFEGIVLNPGFQGDSGLVFRITFEAKQAGNVVLSFLEGAILANDGQGTNLLARLGSASFRIAPVAVSNTSTSKGGIAGEPAKKPPILPVIVDYSPLIDPETGLYIKGKGEPGALTKIVFKDNSVRSIGERLIAFLQSEKKKLDEVFVNNDASGEFQYVSPKNLTAGVYNATPFLVDGDTNTEKPGSGVQLFVDDSKIVKALVVLINVLGLLIPIIVLVIIIYFIPSYSLKRMRVIKKRLELEEEKIVLSEHQLERQDRIAEEMKVAKAAEEQKIEPTVK